MELSMAYAGLIMLTIILRIQLSKPNGLSDRGLEFELNFPEAHLALGLLSLLGFQKL